GKSLQSHSPHQSRAGSATGTTKTPAAPSSQTADNSRSQMPAASASRQNPLRHSPEKSPDSQNSTALLLCSTSTTESGFPASSTPLPNPSIESPRDSRN